MGNTQGGTATSSSTVDSGASLRPFGREEVSKLPLVSHYSYALMALDVYNEPDRRPLEPGWAPLMTCSEVHLDKEGYFATAYVNDNIHHCVIAERGTSDALGIRAGVWMYFDEPTIQFALAEQFSKLVRLRLQFSREDPLGKSYTVSYTGHSLGAVLAACRACAEHTFAVTFESPGCKAFVEKTMHPFKAEDVDIITYLRPPNPINTLRPQCGFLIQLPTPPIVVAPGKGAAAGSSTSMASVASSATNRSVASSSGAATTLTSSPPAGSPGATQGAAAPLSAGAAGGGGTSASPPATSGNAAAAAGTLSATQSVVANIESLVRRFQVPTIALPNAQDYLRAKLLEKSLPELQQFISKLEPILKELLDHTAQAHNIASIVDTMALLQKEDALSVRGQDVILVWPSHLMQFIEYFNVVRSMEDPQNQNAHVYAAYQSLLGQFYKTESQPKHKMPVTFFNRDARKLITLWSMLPPTERSSIPLTATERRVLNTISLVSEVVYSPVLTAFEFKQYVTIIAMRSAVRTCLDLLQPQVMARKGSTSKL